MTILLTLTAGRAGKVLFLNPTPEVFFGGEETLYATADEKYFMLPETDKGNLKEITRTMGETLKEIEDNLEKGKFGITTEGEYARITPSNTLINAMEECRALKGKILDVRDHKTDNLVKTLLPTAKYTWQSQIQTSANTYFLSDGSPLPHFWGKTAVGQKKGVITDCPVYDISNTQFDQQDCTKRLPSVCISRYPPNHLESVTLLEKESRIVEGQVVSQFNRLKNRIEKLTPLNMNLRTNLSVDEILLDPHSSWVNPTKFRTGKMMTREVQQALDRAKESSSNARKNFEMLVSPNQDQKGKLLEKLLKGHLAGKRLQSTKLYYRTPKILIELKIWTAPEVWLKYRTRPIILSNRVPIINRVVYVSQKGETCRYQPSGEEGFQTQTLVKETCCDSLLRQSSPYKCKSRLAEPKDDFCMFLTKSQTRKIVSTNNSSLVFQGKGQGPEVLSKGGTILIVGHQMTKLESTCSGGITNVGEGSHLLRASASSVSCTTRIGKVIVGKVLEAISLMGRDWPDSGPNDNRPPLPEPWLEYLSLGISMLCFLVLSIFAATCRWRNRSLSNRSADRQTGQPGTPVNSIRLKPILKVRTTSTPTYPPSSSDSDSWDDDYD